MLNPKSQIPNPKSQNSKLESFGHWLLFGIWCLVIGIYTNAYALNLDRAKMYFLNGDYKSTISECERILSSGDYPREFDGLYYLLGLSFLKEENYLRASDVFEIILKEFKDSTFKDGAILGLGDVYFLKGDYERAQGYYRELIKDSPQNKLQVTAYHRLSQIGFKKGDTQQGKEYLSKLKNEFPLNLEERSNKDLYALSNLSSDLCYTVQVGSFSNKINAAHLMQGLILKGFPAYIEESAGQGAEKIYRVKVGKLRLRQEAAELEKKLSQEGYPTKICP